MELPLEGALRSVHRQERNIMTYTTITNEGLLMWREDIFATYEEGCAYIEANPLTPNGKPQYLVTTEVALAAQDTWRQLQAEYEVKLREARIAAVSTLI
jgi:hypothetical protein